MSPKHYRTIAEVNARMINDPETPRDVLIGYIEGLEEIHADHLAAKGAEIAKLAKFKAYVHERLDAAGIPTHPDGPHSKEGCRVGDRMDLLIAEGNAARRSLAAAEKDLDNERARTSLLRVRLLAAESALSAAREQLAQCDCSAGESTKPHDPDCAALSPATDVVLPLDGTKSIIRANAEADPNYCPYCMRCSGLVRMRKVAPLHWRCDCGAKHVEPAQPEAPSAAEIRDRAVANVDGRLGYAIEFSNDKAHHAALYDEEEERLKQPTTPPSPAPDTVAVPRLLAAHVEAYLRDKARRAHRTCPNAGLLEKCNHADCCEPRDMAAELDALLANGGKP